MKVIKPNTLAATDGTFTRSSSATYFTADKILSTAATNVPRFNYNPTDGKFEGLLVESAATNLFLYSEQFDNAAWNKTGCTITANTTVSPTGNTTGDTFTNTGNTNSLLSQSVTVPASSTNDYYISLFIKKGNSSTVTLNLYYTGGSEANITFNLDTLTVSGTLPYADDYIFQSVGNGWYRVGYRALRDPTGLATILNFRFFCRQRNFGTSGDTSILYGAQLELGTFPTSYISTTSSATTRSADIVTGSGLIYTTVTDPTAIWSSGTTYTLGSRVRANYKIYESLQNSNLNKPPATEPTWWIELGPDNMHAAFDNQVSTISAATGSMTFVIKAGSIDSVALINMQAITAQLVMYDPVAGIVAQKTAGLSGAEVYDWYQYFFYDPLLSRTQVIFSELPLYSNGIITIQLQGQPSELVSLALVVFGLIEDLGGTQYGATAGIIDYSIKETDDFGTVTFVKRNFSKRLSAQLFIDNQLLNRAARFLYSLRATPAVWIGADDPQLEEAVVVYGFYKEFSIDIAYPRNSLCSLEIEGLT